MNTIILGVFAAGGALGGAAGFVFGRRSAVPPRRRPSGDDVTGPLGSGALPAEVNFEAIAGSLVQRCSERVQMPCALVMRDREGAPAFIVAVTDDLDRRLLDMEVPLTTEAGRAIVEGTPVVGAPNEPLLQTSRRDRRRAIDGGVAVPVGQGPRPVGAVIAFGVPPAGGGDTVHGMMAIARLYEPQLLPAHQVWVAQKRAETDELTNLPNRRYLKGIMARGAGERAALVIMDIDHFKSINDTLGHPAGDAALVHLTKVLRDTLRGGDVAARLGGEEFAVWIQGADQATALEVAERLRARVEQSRFRWQGEERPFTVSCGVAAYPSPIRHPHNLMTSADAALYQAKNAGRNRVVAAGGDVTQG